MALPAEDGVCVLANLPGVPGPEVAEDVRRIFLLRQRSWPDGSPAHPVNLPAASPVRERFSQDVLGASVRELVPYWNDRYFHGTRPPASLASEAAVLLYLARTVGGVGYMADPVRAPLPENVRVLFCTGIPTRGPL